MTQGSASLYRNHHVLKADMEKKTPRKKDPRQMFSFPHLASQEIGWDCMHSTVHDPSSLYKKDAFDDASNPSVSFYRGSMLKSVYTVACVACSFLHTVPCCACVTDSIHVGARGHTTQKSSPKKRSMPRTSFWVLATSDTRRDANIPSSPVISDSFAAPLPRYPHGGPEKRFLS